MQRLLTNRLRKVRATLLTTGLVAAMTGAAFAQVQITLPANPLKAGISALRRGPLLIHGNYCGIGNRPGTMPIDALDEACMRHDACTKTGALPSCACDDRLRLEATAIAQDPRTRPDLQVMAAATASSMAILICKVSPKS